MSAMGKYGAMFSLGLQNTIIYRWNFLFRTVSGLIPLLGGLFLWRALYAARDDRGIVGYDFSAIICYFLYIMVAENLVTPVEDEWQIAADIRDGRLSSFLIRPFDYMLYRLTLFGSGKLMYTAVAILPSAALLWFYRADLRVPHDPSTWFLTAVSLVMAGLLQFFVSYALAMIAFWLLEISTVVFIVYSFEYFLSGRVFPLDLMPASVQRVMEWLPFMYEVYFPVAIFMERVRGPEVTRGLAIQFMWVVFAFAGARLLWARGLQRYQAVGG
jgi:ABC-2 type transport system permease protein